MIEVFEKEVEVEAEEGETETIMEECEEIEATHKHTCYHDEATKDGQARPCKRTRIK